MNLRRKSGCAALIAAVLLVAPAAAGAATVINGNFESGTLQGWQVSQATSLGDWFAYQGTETPLGAKRKKQKDVQVQVEPVQAPPQGAFAAVTDELQSDTLILYQDVALEAGRSHQLSLLAYYDSYKPLAVPKPDTLSVNDEALTALNGEVQPNQQFRIDVMKPEAPLESVDPADILRTVFATKSNAPQKMTPTRLTANLSAFAGQTVRLRIANAATEEVFNAGVDAVSISTSAPGQSASHGSKHGPVLFSFGKIKAYRHRGVATLRVRVSGPGLLRAKGAPVSAGAPRASTSGMLRKPIEPVTVPVAAAKTVTIHLRPTPTARAVLRQGHRLRVKVGVTFMPTSGSPEAASVPVVFRLESRRSQGR
jgi:hypothetical protein